MNPLRLKRIIDNMKKDGLDQLVISAPNSLYYLLGEMFHPGERMLVLYIHASGKHALIVNDLFPNAKKIDSEVLFYNDTEDPIQLLKTLVNENQVFGADKEWPSHFLIRLMKMMPKLKIEIGSVSVDAARMLKDEEEAEKMILASAVNDRVMAEVVKLLKEKKYSEIELKKCIPALYENEQTFEESFSPSVCYGPHTATPHHEADATMPKVGDAIIIDMGGRTNGYCSDMTRSFYYGEPSELYVKIYNLVLEANLAAIARVKPGVKLKDIDLAARDIITNGGYGDYFTHRTGHGIGIEVHEFPDVSAINDMILEVGMVFSVEPGIYLPDVFGVRIEDLVMVTENGCQVLNHYPKSLQIL